MSNNTNQNQIPKQTYQIQFDLITTPLPYAIDLLCSIGDFAILQNKYYIYTSLTKQKIIAKLKKHLTKDEQVLVKQVDDVELFEDSPSQLSKTKGITYQQASEIAIQRVNQFLDDIYTELQNQISNKSS